MTYTIGDRQIKLENESLSDIDKKLLICHLKLFRYCLNNAIHKYLINLKTIIHLYNDIITIYSTLLKKIPNYEDITIKANLSKADMNSLENHFDSIFGSYNCESMIMDNSWQKKSYEKIVKPMANNLLELSQISFNEMYQTLYCIDFFFEKFDNLKKLLIPLLLVQTKSIINSIKKGIYLINLSTIADNLNSITELDSEILKQLKKIEKITSGFEKESALLETGFQTFDLTLQQYTNVLLGKAILKRDIDPAGCQIIKRRNTCYEAAEHVISIPLTEKQLDSSMKLVTKYLIYIIFALGLLICSILYRLLRVLFT